MHANCRAFTRMIETDQSKLFVMHGEHADWAEMMRFAEYALYRMRIRERCNVLYKRVNWKGDKWRTGVFFVEPGQCEAYSKSHPKLYDKSKEVWNECKGCSFGRGNEWVQRIAVGLRGRYKETDDEVEGFTAGATDNARGRSMVGNKPRPQLGGNYRKRVRRSSDRPGRRESLTLGF